MKTFKDARVAIIGLGGMGVRHARACRQLGARVVALCDTRQEALEAGLREAPNAETFRSVGEFAADASRADLVSVVTNTPSRAKILMELLQGGVRRVLTEKPFTTNLADAYAVTAAYEQGGVQLTVNTYRQFCDNHIRLRDLIRSGRLGQPRHISVHSASTGLGNMGSVFFDLMNFYLDSQPVEVTGAVDRTGTPSVRGPQFRDPGGWGVVRYENGTRGFLDTSEDTGVPYTFHLVTTYGRVVIDELFNRWTVSVRSDGDKARPLTYYLAPLADVPFELTHGCDPVQMTGFAMAAALDRLPEAANARRAVTVMEMIMAVHVSDAAGRVPVRLPLERRHHALDIPFA
jgi:predicted dehydrogenase